MTLDALADYIKLIREEYGDEAAEQAEELLSEVCWQKPESE
jgi:hypothetical protein